MELVNEIHRCNATNGQEPFFEIYQDISNYISSVDSIEVEPIRTMTVAYITKITGAALYLQGFFDDDEYAQITQNFKMARAAVGNLSGMPVGIDLEPIILNEDLMKDALIFSIEFINNYNESITHDFCLNILEIADKGLSPCPKDKDKAHNFKTILSKYCI